MLHPRDIATAATSVEGRVAGANRWAAGVLVVTAIGVVVAIGFAPAIEQSGLAGSGVSVWLNPIAQFVPLGVAGAILIDRRPDLPFGWLLALGAVGYVVGITGVYGGADAVVHGNDGAVALWGLCLSGLTFLPIAVQGLVNIRFPTGRLATRRARVLELGMVIGTVLAILGALFGAKDLRDLGATSPAFQSLQHPLTGGTTVGAVFDAFAAFAPVVVLLGLIAGIGVVVRFFRAEGLERQQLKWRAVGVMVAFPLFPFAVSGHLAALDALDSTLFVLTIAIPVLRYRLWAIDTIIRRSFLYGVVTAALVALYAAVTIVIAGITTERVGASIAALAVVVVLAPLRNRVQRLSDRLFYGQRDDPYRTLSELDRRLDTVGSHGEILPAIVDAVASSLRLPYVALERHGDGTALAAIGAPGPRVERWPVAYEGLTEANLVASPRRGEEAFDARDRQLLADVARHAGAAVHAQALTNDLLLSRQRLVTAREEERRRLRRDLHDGLGPLLTGIGLTLDAARAHLPGDPVTADALAADAKDATAQAITDLRQLVYGLRPPALDELGLVPALRAQTERVARGGDLHVALEADDLPTLPAAVEVAAYRAVVEAVNNTVRHGHARHCWVRLQLPTPDEFVVDVLDDGRSVDQWTPGVGLTGMRERAEELGGTLTAGIAPEGGARITVRLPLLGSAQ